MASLRNNFELLLGGEQPAKAGGKKKAKKKGSKQASGTAEAPAAVAVEVHAGDDGDFKPVPKQQVVKSRAVAPAIKPGAEPQAKASDACAALEREAASASGSGRAALAAKWAEQVQQASTGPKYADGGKQLDFKQVLVKSKALDALVEGYLTGCTPADAAPLAVLLAAAAHASAPSDLPSSLAAAVAGLGQLAASDPLSVSAAAKRSVAAALGLLKAGLPVPSVADKGGEAGPASQLGGLATKLERLEAQLPKTTSLKEQVRLWGDIFSTTQQKLDVVGEAGGARVPVEVAAVLGPLQNLHGVLEGRIKEVQNAKSGATVEAQLARAESSYKQEDATMQARLSEVEGRVGALEAELAGLRQEAEQLRERRTWAVQHQEQLLAKIKSGAADSAAAEADLAAGLRAVDQLRASIECAAAGAGPSHDAQRLAAQLVEKEVPGKFISAVQQVVDLGLKMLAELGSKAQFYRDRLAQAVRQREHLALLKLDDAKQREEHKKQTEKLQGMLQEVLAAAEAAAKSCQEAALAYRQRVGLMLSLPNFMPPPPEFGAHLEGMATQASQMLEAISTEPAAAPAAPAPRSKQEATRAATPDKPRANGPRAAERAGPAEAAPAPAAAPVPAPAPSPATDVAVLEQRLAALEAQNREKDAQIAALLSATTVEVPSPLPAMLGSAVLGPAITQAPHFIPGPESSTSLFAQPPAVPLSTPLGPPATVDLGPASSPATTAPPPAAMAAPEGLLGSPPAAAAAAPRPASQQAPKIAASFAQALAAGRGRGGAARA